MKKGTPHTSNTWRQQSADICLLMTKDGPNNYRSANPIYRRTSKTVPCVLARIAIHGSLALVRVSLSSSSEVSTHPGQPLQLSRARSNMPVKTATETLALDAAEPPDTAAGPATDCVACLTPFNKHAETLVYPTRHYARPMPRTHSKRAWCQALISSQAEILTPELCCANWYTQLFSGLSRGSSIRS